MIQINKEKAAVKWSAIIERLGVNDSTRKEWMTEYAEYHSIHENVGLANLSGNLTGMGSVSSPSASSIPGQAGYGTGVAGTTYGNGGVVGSGDYGQQLLPVAMKVAAHTIGLDLVAVKPTPGPVIDLMYVDFRYDDGKTSQAGYNPVVFKIEGVDAAGVSQNTILTTQLRTLMATLGVRELQGGLSQPMYFNLPANSSGSATNVTINTGSTTRAKGSIGTGLTDCLAAPADSASKEGIVEFLGFSRIDKKAMFRAWRTTNQTPQGTWMFERTKNTFGEYEAAVDAFELSNGSTQPLYQNTLGFSDGSTTSGNITIELISALEDHIPGFVSNGKSDAMTRGEEEQVYPGIIAPSVTTKRIQVGTIEISSAIMPSEIEDIKSQTGIDIIQKVESVLVNELSQTISKQIVKRLFDLGTLNRQSAPTIAGGSTIFDFDVDTYLTSGPGGETSQSLQRKLITKVSNASGFLATEGRVGPATFVVTNHTLASVLTEGSNYTLNPVTSSQSGQGQLYPMGKVLGLQIYVDPNMSYTDNRILVGRKNNVEQPGVVFVPYLMAQSVNIKSETLKGGDRLFLRSRYAIAELGFFPQKQYITINVTDTYNRLA